MEPLPETRDALAQLSTYGDRHTAVQLRVMGLRAKRIVPDCVGLSLGVAEGGVTFTLVASSAEVAGVDAMQYLDGGPCVAAVEQATPVEVQQADLLDEGRWLMYAQASAAAGIASSLSLPIMHEDQVVASVNLYASSPHAFEGHHAELAIAMGASAESAVANADLGFSTRLSAVHSPRRVVERHDRNIALGVIAASQGIDIDTARARLNEAAARAGITDAQAARAIMHLHRR